MVEYYLSLQVMLAGRDIGLFVGVLTMGATWVGGRQGNMVER